MAVMAVERPTVKLSNIPLTAIAEDLWSFLESQLGPDSLFALEIFTERKNWKSRGHGRVQFTSLQFKIKANYLSSRNDLVFDSQILRISETFDDIIPRPINPTNRIENGELHVGFLLKDDDLCVLETFSGVRGWVMPERRKVEFWVLQNGDYYKLEVMFDDVLGSVPCRLEDGKNALLLKMKFGPRIYQKLSGPSVASKFSADRYRIFKEDFDFIWVRTTDFSAMKSIGQSTLFCWEVEDGSVTPEIFTSFPYYKEDITNLILTDGEELASTSKIVPLVDNNLGSKLAYEVLYQLNALVHSQKLSIFGVDSQLIQILSGLSEETANIILQKLHKKSTCYEPLEFVKTHAHLVKRNCKKLPISSHKRLTDYNVMSCHRAYVTPLKIYCLGPELETSNYVVKNFAQYASDFMRVTFVDEDWTKLPPNALSTSIQQGILAKPLRTGIYHRILSILREGIVIGAKKFQFLAFSASQLRSNSVWMFASNDNIRAEDIREWMGCFKKIYSISKCAARMGQLFSASKQTLIVPAQDVEMIPDIEVETDGIGYCFSDGIGKISLSFARQVAEKCGLSHTPSAFQIRYGGYKGVIAVDRNSFRKLSLRNSMLKFESNNRMLNITKWSQSMPCYLNREIVTLLSTLGVNDENFEVLLQAQLCLLGRMLTNREAALDALQSLNGADAKNIMVKMLLQGYEPNVEPYLSMMLQAQHENQMTDLRARCRLFVPKGRILVGCLDENDILEYGQVYVRVTMTQKELECLDESFFRKVDETTSIIVGKVIVTKNPCLHPGDVRVLEAVYNVELEEKSLVDCLVFPQRGERPHPNECSGGDLDGDLYFISWDSNLIPCRTENPMDYTARRPRIMDHDVTQEEIQTFFVDYMINDNLGAISTAHLVHADREPDKAMSENCLELASLHSMAVDFAKTGAPAEMRRVLKPKEFPDFMQRFDKSTYVSERVLGKLYRATLNTKVQERSNFIWSEEIANAAYDPELEVKGFEAFLECAQNHKDMYVDKICSLMHYYGAKSEDEILTGNLRNRESYLLRDNRRYGDMKDRIVLSVKSVKTEAMGWFESSCEQNEQQKLASAWYYVTYHPSYSQKSINMLSFPWILGDILLNIKAINRRTHLSINGWL